MHWSYGLTTTPSRKHDLLPATLSSLQKAGFDNPRLFVDGVESSSEYKEFGLPISVRTPNIRSYGNWILALWELYARNAQADRYALFQDDFVTYKNLKTYLEISPYPEKGYCNLYTFPKNQRLIGDKLGWCKSDQLGKGAVALVFNNEAVRLLLANQHTVDRLQNPKRGWRAIDGGVVTSLKNVGWREYVHNPSLVQHTGVHSSMGNRKHPLSESFLGEEFDAMELLDHE